MRNGRSHRSANEMSIELEPAEVRRAAKAVILGALLGSLLAVLARSPVRGRVRAADD